MSEEINFLVLLRRTLAFDHCYDFYHMKEVFEKPLELIKKNLDLSYICINGLYEEDIQQVYSIGKLNTDESLSNLLSFPISRGERPIGYLRLCHNHINELDLNLVELITTILAQPLHQWIKSRTVELMGHSTNEFKPHTMIATSRPMGTVFSLIKKILDTKTTVLLLGESGVGKEKVAHEIHYQGNRKQGPFICVNCAAIPSELVESELFGHKKGAFTGAIDDRKGKFEEAHQGTLFLDEIGELSLEVQCKLLRVLQDKEVVKVGSNKSDIYDVRVVAATNVNLEEKVSKGEFRKDLYYRLNVFPIKIPPLRNRKDDIIPLSDFFVNKFSREASKRIIRISTSALDMLMAYHWPGNVRELANVIERAVLMSENGVLQGRDLPPSLQLPEKSHPISSLELRLQQFERDIIIDSLKAHKGNMRQAALNLGITERKMNLRVRRYNIDRSKFKKNNVNVGKNLESTFM